MNTPKLQIKIGLQRRRDVMSLQHAQVVWQEHRTMGASEAPKVKIYLEGIHSMNMSYNGRIWNLAGDEVPVGGQKTASQHEAEGWADCKPKVAKGPFTAESPRFVWNTGSIKEEFPDMPEQSGAIDLVDRSKGRVVVSIAEGWGQLFCLEHAKHGQPFTDLATWMNGLSKDDLESEGLPTA